MFSTLEDDNINIVCVNRVFRHYPIRGALSYYFQLAELDAIMKDFCTNLGMFTRLPGFSTTIAFNLFSHNGSALKEGFAAVVAEANKNFKSCQKHQEKECVH